MTILVAKRRLKFVPVIITWSPGLPLVGAKLVMVGGPSTIKGRIDMAFLLLTVTLILPVVAVLGTVTVNWVDDALLIEATTSLNFTILSWTDELKLVPSIKTWAPTMPLAGKKFVIVGAFTAGGGGYGAAGERARELIERDGRMGYMKVIHER